MQGQFLDDSVGIELSGSGGIQEGQENARLLREHPDRFEGTKVDEIEEFVNGGGSGKVSNVDGATRSSVGGTKGDLEGSRRILCLFLIKCQIINRWGYRFNMKVFLPESWPSGWRMGIPPWFRERSSRESPCLACCSRNPDKESWL